MSEDLTNYNGKLVEIVPDTEDVDSGYLLLDPIDENGMQYQFNYGPDTQFNIDKDTLQAGDLLNVLHSPISTRSLPPQSPAYEISPYTAPEADELPIPAADAPQA